MKIAEILLENGAEIEARNMMDLTPFLMSVIHGSKETAEMLLDQGANLMAVDFAHNSCLHLAVINKQIETIQMLLIRAKEKLMELRNSSQKTVIHLAACYEDPEVTLAVLILSTLTSTLLKYYNKKLHTQCLKTGRYLSCYSLGVQEKE